jgi:hypothetical protein
MKDLQPDVKIRPEYAWKIYNETLTFVQNMYDIFAPGLLDSSWICMKDLQRDVKIRPEYAWNIYNETLRFVLNMHERFTTRR